MLNTTEELIEAIRNGEMIILMDDEDRENEGDLIVAAEKLNYEQLNFILNNTSGIICLTLTEEDSKRLDLPLMIPSVANNSKFGTNFTVTIEAARGVTTGVSVSDRLTTIKAAIADGAMPEDLSRPGHIFPIIARDGGVLKRNGHTEASVDFAKLAGLKPFSVLCEIMNKDGTMKRKNELVDFAKNNNLKIGTIKNLVKYRENYEEVNIIKEVS